MHLVVANQVNALRIKRLSRMKPFSWRARVRVYRGSGKGMLGIIIGERGGCNYAVDTGDGLVWEVESRNLEICTPSAASCALMGIRVKACCFGCAPDLAADGWTDYEFGKTEYETERAARLYAIIGAEIGDEEYSLAKHRDGRWGLFGLTVEGHPYAVEDPEL